MANERYSRQVILQGFGEQAQQRLSDARVVVIGAGGLGCPALQYLAGAGVGQIGIADGDSVSLSNLHRQPLFHTADVGKMKADVALERLAALNPEISINLHPVFINADNCLQMISGYHIVLDCSDNFSTRYLLNDACVLLDKPLIFAAVSGYEGQIGVFATDAITNKRTNYRDLFPVQPEQGEIANCEESGVIGVLPGIMGAMQAAEAIKLITDIGRPLINKLLSYNLLTQEFYEVLITPAPTGSYSLPNNSSEFSKINYSGNNGVKSTEVVEIDIEQLQELIQSQSTSVIDVREVYELPVIAKIKSIQIPMSVFNKGSEKPLSGRNIVLICQHGIRSLAAGHILKEKYGKDKNVFSLKGGVARWSGFL
jgi:molybdopterin/thiamine biosynthesis adenylyltransferase/rhodanese-related sulfurtransferase